MSRAPLGAAALEYAHLGLPVFPCQRHGKKPLTQHGVLDATTDHDTVASWWLDHPAANIGISCIDLVVIDQDGPDGAENFKTLVQALGWPGASPLVRTARGLHRYYRAPAGIDIRPKVAWRPGIDIRAAESYVIAPPSTHSTGITYILVDDHPIHEAPTLPDTWAAEMLPKTPATRTAAKVRPVTGIGSPYGASALRGLLDDLAAVKPGARNARTYAAARRVLDLAGEGHLPDGRGALRRVAEVAQNLGLSEFEVARTIKSAAIGAGTGTAA